MMNWYIRAKEEKQEEFLPFARSMSYAFNKQTMVMYNGYWMLPTGKIIDVKNVEHDDYVFYNPEVFGLSKNIKRTTKENGILLAFNKGALRIAAVRAYPSMTLIVGGARESIQNKKDKLIDMAVGMGLNRITTYYVDKKGGTTGGEDIDVRPQGIQEVAKFNLRLYRLAQIWNVDMGDDGIEDKIRSLYELEYKYSMLKDKPFNGLPERRDNILRELESRLSEVLDEVKGILSRVFENWLKNHALLSAETWARGRVGDPDELEAYGAEDSFNNMIFEYVKYAINNGQAPFYDSYGNQRQTDYRKYFMEMINQAKRNIRYFPALSRFFEQGLYGYKEMEKETLYSEGLKEFGRMHGKRFKDQDQAEAYIDNLTINDIDLESLYNFEDVESFAKSAEQMGLAEDILVELYKKFVFPHWVRYWKDQGIAETRKGVEKIYRKLQSISSADLRNALAVISLALNASHQTGEMWDYISSESNASMSAEQMKGFLTEMSSGTYVEEWNNQLREIGVQI